MHNLRPNSPGIAFLLGLSALSASCLFRHSSPMVFTPPPAPARPQLPPPVPPILPAPPEISTDTDSNVPPLIATSIPDLAPPPAPKPQQKKQAATTPPKPAAPSPAEPPAQPPRLVQLFTPEQEREYNRNIDESLNRVRHAQEILSRKTLSADQNEAATRIAAFAKQAEEARGIHDLAGAALLAQRAATLADDLLTRVP